MSKNIAEQFVEILVKAGIKRIYAVTGDSLNFLNDAIKREGSIQWIHVDMRKSVLLRRLPKLS